MTRRVRTCSFTNKDVISLMKQEDFWNRRWPSLFWVSLVGFVLSCNYTNHGPLLPVLIQVFGITLGAAGLFTTAIFLAHALLQIPGGAMSDRFGAKQVGTFGLIVIAAGNILLGFATTYHEVLLFKFIAGIGTGSAIQAGLRYVPTFFKGKELGLGQGVYGGSILLGSGFVIYVIPLLTSYLSWHGVFFLTGSMAVVLAVLWFLFAPGTPAAENHFSVPLKNLVTNRNILVLTMTQIGSFGTATACGSWINVMLQRSVHMDPKTAGMIGSLVFIVGIVGRPMGGWILDHKWLSAKAILCLAHLLLAAGFIGVGLSSTSGEALLSIIVVGMASGLPFGPIFAEAPKSFPDNPGAANGFVNTFGAGAVMILPPVMGALVDHTGTFLSAFYLLGGIALIASLTALALRIPPLDSTGELGRHFEKRTA